MKLLREHWLAIALSLFGLVVTLVLYPRMPDPVPVHWNIRGEVDGWMRKPWGPLIGPLINIAMAALLIGVRAISPKEAPIERFARVYVKITAGVAGVFAAITTLIAIAGTGAKVDTARALAIILGAMFVMLGNFMGKVTPNYFVGIRTPWTLSNDEVWFRTHRFGGKVFVIAGAASILAALAGFGLHFFLVAAFSAALLPVVYSYVVYKELQQH